VAAGSGNEIVLVHTITTYADCADKNTVAIKAKRTRENRDPVRETGIWSESEIWRDANRIATL
jgi:hypothetical protein